MHRHHRNGVEKRGVREGVTVRTHEALAPHLKSPSHMTCVHAAAQLGCLGCLKWMIEHIGLPPDEADEKYGATPLHYAANCGHPKIIRFLLQRVTKVHTDYDGATPLHDAAMQGHLACVQELLKSSLVNPSQVDNYGLTAGEWAEQAQERKCAKLIHDSIIKQTASLTKGKKATPKREKQTLPLCSPEQRSDSADSYLSSPTSETYAQLEPPADCFCESSSHLPPKLPDTPRPSKNDGAPKHRCGKVGKEKLKTPTSEVELIRLPPPPPSMLQSLVAANTTPCIPIPAPPQVFPFPVQTADYVNNRIGKTSETALNISKPVSAVQPYNHLASSPTTVSIVTADTPSQVSFVDTPPAPQHSFSTFSVTPPRRNPKEIRSPPKSTGAETIQQIDGVDYAIALPVASAFQLRATANPSYNLTNHEDRCHHQEPLNNSYSNVTTHDGCKEVPCANHINRHGSGAQGIEHVIPDWKRQLQLQIAKKQEKQIESSAAVPDWKKLVQERKQESMKKERGDNPQPEVPSGLAPWQSELKKAGRILGVDFPEEQA